MNNLKIIFLALIVALGFSSCDDDDRITSINLGAPQNIDARFSIEQDNSGEVTITPSAEGASTFAVNFGDGSEVSEEFQVGNSITHIYEEGTFTVEIFATSVSGEMGSVEKELLVSFLPPENLEVNISISNANPFEISVQATADNAMGFNMFFGEVEDEEPTFVLAGELGVYEYSDVGTFTVTVVALSGGAATTELSQDVVISDPFVLPITFESPTVNYVFNNFGGGEGDGVPIIDNPDPNEVNSSQKVASYTKPVGSEVWAGTSALLNEIIDFSGTTTIAMDVWSPQAGIPILFKIEQEGNPDVFVESIQNTTVANEWETLTFNLPGASQNDFSIIAIFFNWETEGAGETYYFDNIELTTPVELGLPLDFEAGAEFYNFIEFEGAPTDVISNPDQSGINTSANVARTLKASGAATFAGSFIDLTNPIDFSISSVLTMKVWSPIANNEIILKLEDPTTDAEFEVSTVVNTTNEWTEVTFDFTGADTSVDWTRVIFFFDFGNTGSGLEFFFDDLNYVTDAESDIVGTWVVANEDGSLGVGPAAGDVSWFNCNGPCLTERACYFDDTYTFGADGSFTNGFGGGDTWVESWQGVASDQCSAPVAPHDGSNAATYTLNANNTLTLSGEGAYIGLAKAVNAGELPNVPVPANVTYDISFESPTVMRVTIESGSGVFWQYKLVKQ